MGASAIKEGHRPAPFQPLRTSPRTPPLDVVDHIIGLGEEQSVRLLASTLKTIGVYEVEVTPDSPSWPIVTDENYGDTEPRLDGTAGSVPGMSVTVGRLRSGIGDRSLRFVMLGHNTIRGAARGAVSPAKLLAAKG